MAKQNTLPSVDDGASVRPQPPQQQPPEKDFQPVIAEGYMPRRIDVKLPMKHRQILHAKLRILQDAGATLADGTEVSDKTKAVLWILENEVKT